MDNKSWRSISNMKQNDNTVNSHIPNCNSFSINENCVKQIQNTEPNQIYEQSSELKEKINELNLIEKYQPKEVIICCFIDKKCARKIDVDVDYVGYTIDKPAFLMGYGLDYNEFARNIDYVYIPPKEEIELYDKLSK